MKKLTGILVIGIIAGVGALNNQKAMAQDLKGEKDTVSYLLGYNLGGQIKQIPYQMNLDKFVEGFLKSAKGEESGFKNEEIDRILKAWQENVQKEAEAKERLANESQSIESKAIGAKFLAENAKVKGVKTTASGLQYKVVTMAKGEMPKATDKVKVHYTGTLIDGTKFDSSVDRGEPITFPLSGVIKGWTEGLQLMPVGSKFMFYIPSDLAYGDRAMSTIPAGSTLIFEVELLGINPAE